MECVSGSCTPTCRNRIPGLELGLWPPDYCPAPGLLLPVPGPSPALLPSPLLWDLLWALGVLPGGPSFPFLFILAFRTAQQHHCDVSGAHLQSWVWAVCHSLRLPDHARQGGRTWFQEGCTFWDPYPEGIGYEME